MNHSDSDKHKTNDNKVFKKGDGKTNERTESLWGDPPKNITKEKCVQEIEEKISLISYDQKYFGCAMSMQLLIVQNWASPDSVIYSVIAF